MRRTLITLLVGSLAASLSSSASGQTGGLNPGGLVEGSLADPAAASDGFKGLEHPSPPDTLTIYWAIRRDMLSRGDREGAAKRLAEIEQLRIDLGVRNLNRLALALIQEAWLLETADQGARAVASARAALRLAPDSPEPHMALARLYITGQLNPGRAVQHALTGTLLALQHPIHQRRLLLEALLRLLVGILAVFVVFALTLWIRYGRLLHHDVGDLLPRGVSSVQRFILVSLLGLGPLLLGLPLIGVAGVWCLLLWGYMQARERCVVLVAVLLVGCLDPILALGDRLLGRPPLAEALYMASFDLPEEAALARLQAAAKMEKPESDVLVALGLVEKRRGRLRRAERYFRRAIEASKGRSPAAAINLGNVYLADNRLDEAQKLYEEVVRKAPEMVEGHFNMARLYYAKAAGDIEGAIARARLRDEARVDVAQYIQSLGLNRFTMDATINVAKLRRRLLLPPPPERPILGPVFLAVLAKEIPAQALMPLSGIFFALLCGLWVAQKRFFFSGRCKRCGAALCQPCGTILEGAAHCTSCVHTYYGAAQTDARRRYHQEKVVNAYRLRRRSLGLGLTFTLTGAGHLILGKTLRGVIFLCCCFLFVGLMNSWEGLVRAPEPSGPHLPLGTLLTASLVYAIIYAIAVLDVRVEDGQ